MADFNDVYKRYFRDVYHYAFSLCKNDSMAEEITQETFFKALNSWTPLIVNVRCQFGSAKSLKNTYISICWKEKHGSYT